MKKQNLFGTLKTTILTTSQATVKATLKATVFSGFLMVGVSQIAIKPALAGTKDNCPLSLDDAWATVWLTISRQQTITPSHLRDLIIAAEHPSPEALAASSGFKQAATYRISKVVNLAPNPHDPYKGYNGAQLRAGGTQRLTSVPRGLVAKPERVRTSTLSAEALRQLEELDNTPTPGHIVPTVEFAPPKLHALPKTPELLEVSGLQSLGFKASHDSGYLKPTKILKHSHLGKDTSKLEDEDYVLVYTLSQVSFWDRFNIKHTILVLPKVSTNAQGEGILDGAVIGFVRGTITSRHRHSSGVSLDDLVSVLEIEATKTSH